MMNKYSDTADGVKERETENMTLTKKLHYWWERAIIKRLVRNEL